MIQNKPRMMPPRASGWGAVLVHCYLVIVFSSLISLYALYSFDPADLIYPVCVAILGMLLWALWSWKQVALSSFDPYILFFIAAVLFNGGQALLEVFGLNKDGILWTMFTSSTTLDTLILVLLCLALFHLGGLFSVKSSRYRDRSQAVEHSPLLLRDVRVTGWVFILVSIIPALYVMKGAVAIVLSAGYAALYQQDNGTSFSAAPKILADFLVPGALFLLAGSKARRFDIAASIIVIIAYGVVQFFLGARSKAAMPLIAYAWLWHRSIRSIPRTLLLGSAALAIFVLFPLVGASRNASGAERASLSFLAETFTSINNPIVASVSEMGGSMITVAYTLELVPSLRDFEYGSGYLYALLTIMPNLFWDIHPTIAHGLPSDWLTWTVDPWLARQGGGLGFSFIAEAYLNFGRFGAPIAIGCIGFMFGKLTTWAMWSANPARLAMIASFSSFALFWVRQEATEVVRPLLWYALIPYVTVYVVGALRSRFANSS